MEKGEADGGERKREVVMGRKGKKRGGGLSGVEGRVKEKKRLGKQPLETNLFLKKAKSHHQTTEEEKIAWLSPQGSRC